MTPQQIADQLDAQHAAQFAPVSPLDAPTFTPADIAALCGVDVDTVTYHARVSPGHPRRFFPTPIDPKSWTMTWERSQWPVVLLAFLGVSPKARRSVAQKLGLSVVKTTAHTLVSEVLRNPFRLTQAPA